MALSLSFVASLPGGHKKVKRFLCEVMLARSSFTILDSRPPGQPLLGCHRHQTVSLTVHSGQISNFWATFM